MVEEFYLRSFNFLCFFIALREKRGKEGKSLPYEAAAATPKFLVLSRMSVRVV